MSTAYGRQDDDYIVTPDQIEGFHKNGYVTFEGVMSEQELSAI